jgi:5-methylcytosine-specific restriction enzyme A
MSPSRPSSPCRYPRCPNLATQHGYCDQHKQQAQQQQDRERGNSSERGYDWRWQRIRLNYINSHPLCLDCYEMIPRQITAATEVHHIIALRDGGTSDDSNLRPLCKACHNKRTLKGE